LSEPINLLFIDSEGLDDVQNSSDKDILIMQFTSLLSSHVIFNSLGNIRGAQLIHLNAISDLTVDFSSKMESIRKSKGLSQQKKLKIDDLFPKITFAV